MKKGDFVIWNSNLPHTGGNNLLKNHWRLHAFVRFLALDGPYVDNDQRNRVLQYRDMVTNCIMTGVVPTHFPTLNHTHVKPQQRGAEVPNYKVPELTDLGKKLFGFSPWSDSDKLFKKV